MKEALKNYFINEFRAAQQYLASGGKNDGQFQFNYSIDIAAAKHFARALKVYGGDKTALLSTIRSKCSPEICAEIDRELAREVAI